MNALKQWPIYFIGRILPAAVGFAGIAVYTRLLDPASFGTYALLLSTSFLIGLVAYSWLRVASLRMVATVADADKANLMATISVAFVAVSILVCAASLAIVRLYDPGLGWTPALLTAACTVASGWFELNIAIIQARIRVVAFGLLQMARAVGTLLASLLLIVAGFKANALLGGFAIGNCAGFGALGLWTVAARGRFDLVKLKEFMAFGWPSSAAGFSYLINTYQRFALDMIGGAAAVGIYAAAGDFSRQTIGLLIGTATIAGQPLAFRARDLGSQEQLAEQLRNNARLIFAVALPATAGVIALAGPISHIYLGRKFHADSGTIMAITAAFVFLNGIRGSYFEQVFEITRKTLALAVNTLFRVILTIGLSIWLIGLYGAVGAAMALLLAEVFGLGLSIVWARRLMHVPVPWQSLSKIVLAAAAMVIAIPFVPGRSTLLGLCVAVAVGALVYATVIALTHLRGIRAYVGSFSPASGATRP